MRTRLPASLTRLRTCLSGLWKRRVPRALITIGVSSLLCVLALTVLVGTVSACMKNVTRGNILPVTLSEPPDLSGYDCILVLGAGVQADGTASPMLEDRVITACELYRTQTANPIPLLMSGDHTGDYNEVGVMKQLAMEAGVPGEHVFLDHAGYSTYESLWRAKEIFGAEKVVIVSQGYHLYRALFIARELGLEAVGQPADLRDYYLQTRYELRESLARFKDLFTAARCAPVTEPGIPVGPVDLDGNGNDT